MRVIAVIVVLVLAVGVGFFFGAQSNAKSALRLDHLETVLRAAEELPLEESTDARAALEQVAILELTVASILRPPIDETIGREKEVICRAMRYFASDHPSATIRAPEVEGLVAILRPYLAQLEGEIEAEIKRDRGLQIFFPECVSYFSNAGMSAAGY